MQGQRLNSIEILGLVVALFVLGYWIVSALLDRIGTHKKVAQSQSTRPESTPPVDAANTPAWHEILNVAPQASLEEIRLAYRALMSQYHPDKVATLGPELRALAERKSKQITCAYREATQGRGTDT